MERALCAHWCRRVPKPLGEKRCLWNVLAALMCDSPGLGTLGNLVTLSERRPQLYGCVPPVVLRIGVKRFQLDPSWKTICGHRYARYASDFQDSCDF